MKLLTKELEKAFEKYPIGSQDGKYGKAKVIAKFFNPMGAGTWIITEGSKMENGDYEMFGYCNLGDDDMAEFGYVYLSQLQELKLPLGMTVERDLYMSKDKTIAEAIKECGFTVPHFLIANSQENQQEMEDNELEI